MLHRDIYDFIEKIAPLELAEKWDPVGHQLGDEEAKTTGVVLALDLLPQTIELAKRNGANLIVTHHPQFFSPLKNLSYQKVENQLCFSLIKDDIALYSAHTNLDAAEEGVAYQLASRVLTGLEHDELEILIKNSDNTGHGRYCTLNKPQKFSEFYNRVSRQLQAPFCRVCDIDDSTIRNVCFCPGAFDEDWISDLLANDIDVLVTGEMKHHVGIALMLRDIRVIVTGHDTNERVVLQPLAEKLRETFPQLAVYVDLGIDYVEALRPASFMC